MDEEDRIKAGDYCETLLRADYFNALCGEFEQDGIKQLLATQPHETKTRESIYSTVKGLSSFLALLASKVQDRDHIVKSRIEQDASVPPAEDDFFDDA